MTAKALLSEQGRERIRAELRTKRARHERVCEERAAAFESCGDGWHDNPEFNRLAQEEAGLTHEIARLELRLGNLQLLQVTEGERPCDCVRPGSLVEICVTDKSTGASERARWGIGGEGDSDKVSGVLGWDAPLARAIAFARPGELLNDVRVGHRLLSIEVLALHPGPWQRARE